MDSEQEKKLIKFLKNNKATTSEIAEKIGVEEEAVPAMLEALAETGVRVESHRAIRSNTMLHYIRLEPETGNVFLISKANRQPTTMDFAVTSDWHFASKYHLPKSWHEAMKRTADAGITHVYVAGDIVDGIRIYKGHHENVWSQSIEDQTDMAAEAMSKHPTLEFWAIAGNHDYSYTQQTGAKPLAILEAKLDNFRNLGDFRADVIYQGIRMRLLHGGTGRAYAKSYPSQIYLRDYFSGLEHEELRNTPHVLFLGHFHTYYDGFDHGMHILQPGSFQDGDNEFCIRRGFTGPTGLWHVRIVNQGGMIAEYRTTYIKPIVTRKEKGKMHARNTKNYGR